MAEIKDLSTTDASNNGTAANAGFPEAMPPSDVNNAARALEGMIARIYADTNGTLATTGSANAYLLAPNRTISAVAAGDAFLVKANHANTGAATLNVSSLGAKAIVLPSGAALAGGEIQADGIYLVAYDGTSFQLLGASSGSLDYLGSPRVTSTAQGAAITGGSGANVIATLTAAGTFDPVFTLTGDTFGARLYMDQDASLGYLRQTAADGTTLEDVWMSFGVDGSVSTYFNNALSTQTVSTGLDVFGTILDLDNSSAATPTFLKARNSEGGLSIGTDGGSVTVYQTDSAGSAQDTWIALSQNGGVAMYYDNAARVTSTSAGATVTGTLNATTALTAGGVAAMLVGGELNSLVNATKSLVADPGYYTLPGGLTVQWGKTAAKAGDGSQSDTFSQAFTTFFQVVCFPHLASGSREANYAVTTTSTTGFTIDVNYGGGTGNIAWSWIALGYIA
jgi:hypothetical protein